MAGRTPRIWRRGCISATDAWNTATVDRRIEHGQRGERSSGMSGWPSRNRLGRRCSCTQEGQRRDPRVASEFAWQVIGGPGRSRSKFEIGWAARPIRDRGKRRQNAGGSHRRGQGSVSQPCGVGGTNWAARPWQTPPPVRRRPRSEARKAPTPPATNVIPDKPMDWRHVGAFATIGMKVVNCVLPFANTGGAGARRSAVLSDGLLTSPQSRRKTGSPNWAGPSACGPCIPLKASAAMYCLVRLVQPAGAHVRRPVDIS